MKIASACAIVWKRMNTNENDVAKVHKEGNFGEFLVERAMACQYCLTPILNAHTRAH
jgi:hypothetical protein